MSYLPYVVTGIMAAFLFFRAVWIEALQDAYATACKSKEFGKKMNPKAIWSRAKMFFHFWVWDEETLIVEDESRQLFGNFIDKVVEEAEKDSSD